MKTEKIFKSYLSHQVNFKEKWILFQNSKINFNKAHYIPELTPLFGTYEFTELSIDKRYQLFFEYTKLVAEALVLFEQTLVFGVRQLKTSEIELKAAIHQFASEELYHSQGFRHFLILM